MTKLTACQLHYDHMEPEPEDEHKECTAWVTAYWSVFQRKGSRLIDRVLLKQKCKECDNTREIYEDEL